MSAIEISPIKTPMTIRFGGSKVSLPADVRQKIDQHWQQLIQANPRLHNGEVFTVTAVADTVDELQIELAETDYAHYLYSRQVGGLGEFTVRIIHSATLVIATNNKMIFGAMAAHTSIPGVIQCCAGGIEHGDIREGIVDIEYNTASI
jgi:hypothetical protein